MCSLRLCDDRMKMNIPKKYFIGRLPLFPGSHFSPQGPIFRPSYHLAFSLHVVWLPTFYTMEFYKGVMGKWSFSYHSFVKSSLYNTIHFNTVHSYRPQT